MKKLVLIPVIALLAACSDSSNEPKETKTESKDVTLTAKDVKEWPFSFDSITIRCEFTPAVVGENNGVLYALNGIANSQASSKGFTPVTPSSNVWLDNKDIPGTKISISAVIDAGINACK